MGRCRDTEGRLALSGIPANGQIVGCKQRRPAVSADSAGYHLIEALPPEARDRCRAAADTRQLPDRGKYIRRIGFVLQASLRSPACGIQPNRQTREKSLPLDRRRYGFFLSSCTYAISRARRWQTQGHLRCGLERHSD